MTDTQWALWEELNAWYGLQATYDPPNTSPMLCFVLSHTLRPVGPVRDAMQDRIWREVDRRGNHALLADAADTQARVRFIRQAIKRIKRELAAS